MKKIDVLILFAFSISFMNAQKSEETIRLEKLNLKPIEFVIDEQTGKIDNETRVLRVNRNESFKSETLDETNAIVFYLQEKREVYGLSSNLNDIKIVKTVESLAGQYVYCQQYVNDIPVFATNFTIYFNKENTVTYALNEFRNVAKYRDIQNKPSVNINDALKTANEYLNITGDVIGKPKTELVYVESMDKGLELAWKININAMKPIGDWQIFISASDGHIIHVEDISMYMYADGNGKVFQPNPLVSANVSYGGNYVHNGGATNTYLESQQFQVTLKDLTYENGLYKLKGPYCVVKDITYPYGHTIPEDSTANFYYARNQLEFGAVMCYYYVDLAARRILELGYDIPDSLKNFRIDPHGMNGDPNAQYVSSGNYVHMGSGYASGNSFVPACEDADVILHEYAHAMQYNIGAGSMSTLIETQSIKEGSSDYWATSFKRSIYTNNWAAYASWFTMYYLNGRRTDLNWTYPTNMLWGAPHDCGQIWSSALMKIWGDLGRDITDQLFLETHKLWGKEPKMRDAATAFMKADLNLYNGSHLCQIYSRFQEHGLIDTNQIVNTTNYVNDIVTADKIVFSCSDLNVQNVKVQSGKLFLDAAGTTTINGDFEVVLGAELEIK